MLVLSRKRSERIFIGDNIIVTLLEIRHDSVLFGIYAPQNMPVHREEIYEAIEREKLQQMFDDNMERLDRAWEDGA